MRNFHSSCKQGKRVIILLRNGDKIEGKFKENRSNFILLENEKVEKKKIRSLIIKRGIR